jgi:flagellar biosynthetic protein FliR
MHAELTLNLATLYGFLLVLARVSGVILMVPIPGLPAVAPASRILLALALVVALLPAWPALPVTGGPSAGTLLGWIGTEALFGLTIGVAISFLLEGIQLAAQMIGLQAGYSFASTVDPTTQADSTTLQVMAQLLAGCLFFAFGFDRRIVQTLAGSLEAIPLGAYSISEMAADRVVRLGARMFSTGLQLAMPVLALMILADIAFAVLGRLHSQLQLLSLSFTVKMLAAVAFLAGVLATYPAVFEKTGRAAFNVLESILNP